MFGLRCRSLDTLVSMCFEQPYTCTQNGRTALLIAAAEGYTECVRLLLEAGLGTEDIDSVRGWQRDDDIATFSELLSKLCLLRSCCCANFLQIVWKILLGTNALLVAVSVF
jgi:ankyrin repeat protein